MLGERNGQLLSNFLLLLLGQAAVQDAVLNEKLK